MNTQTYTQADHLSPLKAPSKRGFTMVELMISFSLFMILSMTVLGAITTLHNTTRRQAAYNSVLVLMLSEQEALRDEDYAPPNDPFSDKKHIVKLDKSIALNTVGTATMVDVALTTSIEPVLSVI